MPHKMIGGDLRGDWKVGMLSELSSYEGDVMDLCARNIEIRPALVILAEARVE